MARKIRISETRYGWLIYIAGKYKRLAGIDAIRAELFTPGKNLPMPSE